MKCILIAPSEFFNSISSLVFIFFILALTMIFIYEYEALRKEKG